MTHQLRSLSARVVCEKAEAFVAVALQEDHTGRWVTVPEQADMNEAWEGGEMEMIPHSDTYLVAVAMHMAFASPISGHLVA